MCGIVGLLAKTPPMRRQLGRLMEPMFACMAERGPDSGGCAFFDSAGQANARRFSLLVKDRAYDWQAVGDAFRQSFARHNRETQIEWIENHALLTTSVEAPDVQSWFARRAPQAHLLSVGRSMKVYKDEGHPVEIANRFRFKQASGSHCVAHTRMATESAVTPAHSHPFTAGEDFCLVHNGSLSNPHMLRRKLQREGLTFETDNDTEAACRFIEWRLRQADALDVALTAAFEELDGFFTLLMATESQLCLVRDSFACKPAVVAETDEYVAIGSEFRSLAHLPGAADAAIFEPKPEEIYSWQV